MTREDSMYDAAIQVMTGIVWVLATIGLVTICCVLAEWSKRSEQRARAAKLLADSEARHRAREQERMDSAIAAIIIDTGCSPQTAGVPPKGRTV